MILLVNPFSLTPPLHWKQEWKWNPQQPYITVLPSPGVKEVNCETFLKRQNLFVLKRCMYHQPPNLRREEAKHPSMRILPQEGKTALQLYFLRGGWVKKNPNIECKIPTSDKFDYHTQRRDQAGICWGFSEVLETNPTFQKLKKEENFGTLEAQTPCSHKQ